MIPLWPNGDPICSRTRRATQALTAASRNVFSNSQHHTIINYRAPSGQSALKRSAQKKTLLHMKILFSIFLILWVIISPSLANDEMMEEYIVKMHSHLERGEYEHALPYAVNLMIWLDPHETVILDGGGSNLFFFDLGNILVQLKRWSEAKYCFTRCIIGNHSDTKLQKAFGLTFSRNEWFASNRLEEQSFFKQYENKGLGQPKAEQDESLKP